MLQHHTCRLTNITQNNLKNLDLRIRTGEFVTLTGRSGAGKTSLAKRTLYTEGARRYIETFSPYTRQFIEKLPAPKVGNIEGILPSIAIERSNKVRTPRSTVGTITGIEDHIRVLFNNQAHLFCPTCHFRIKNFTPEEIWNDLLLRLHKANAQERQTRLAIVFARDFPLRISRESIRAVFAQDGYTHILRIEEKRTLRTVFVIADRFRWTTVEARRAIDAIKAAQERGNGLVSIWLYNADKQASIFMEYHQDLYCGLCHHSFTPKSNDLFSFNSPLGACPLCRGSGLEEIAHRERFIAWDEPFLHGVLPLTERSLPKYELAFHAALARHKISPIRTYRRLINDPKVDLTWFWEGEPEYQNPEDTPLYWCGADRLLLKIIRGDFIAGRKYGRLAQKRFVGYRTCQQCHGQRLKDAALHWRFCLEDPEDLPLPRTDLPGWNFHELINCSIELLYKIIQIAGYEVETRADELLLESFEHRLHYLKKVGLGYLTPYRQTRTLSGGELQRATLTQALGTAVTNMLFVIEEPSTGLHPSDLANINEIMHRITQAGNALVAIRHDPQVIVGSDRIIHLGPGSGRQGGHIVFDGTPKQAWDQKQYTALAMRPHSYQKEETALFCPTKTWNHLTGNNLKDLSVRIALGKINVLTGVSGSGKSTLLHSLYQRAKNRHLENPNNPACYLIDQTPLTVQSRSTVGTFLDLLTILRQYFAKVAPWPSQPSDFSSQTSPYRCRYCNGLGYEQIDMQFMAEVTTPCPVCQGARFQDKILRATLPTKSGRRLTFPEVLNLSLQDLFTEILDNKSAQLTQLHHLLHALELDHLRLGQCLTTLSLGELQRLKMVGELREIYKQQKKSPQPCILFLDEPTTGLHFREVQKLMDLLHDLTKKEHTIIMVEHNLQAIDQSYYIVDLGPVGGDQGGYVLFNGPTALIFSKPKNKTAQALKLWTQWMQGKNVIENKPKTSTHVWSSNCIEIRGAREHNLQNIDINIPRDQFNVIVGRSGSGKSTLAYNIVFAEGQRRYVANLSAYARSRIQMPPIPRVDSIQGIAPPVSIEQHVSRGGYRSTVGTLSEIYHYLRLIYSRVGQHPRQINSHKRTNPLLFSFNSPIGACARCKGYGWISEELQKKLRREEEPFATEFMSLKMRGSKVCPSCHGQRLNKTALQYLWHEQTIAQLCEMSLENLFAWTQSIKLTKREQEIIHEPFAELQSRLTFLCEVGLSYLSLNRAAPTLSGGEAQRIRLSTQLGSNLQGVCYVLDRPTIGLHAKDNARLIQALRKLTQKGNTLLVVRHDEETIRAADTIIEIGPEAGAKGGRLIHNGSLATLLKKKNSVTAQCLLDTSRYQIRKQKLKIDAIWRLKEIRLRNLNIPSLELPLGKFIVIAGVSGSGKSTLCHDYIKPFVQQALDKKEDLPFTRICEVDQKPLGGSLYSCPATYLDFASSIRTLFASVPLAKERGYKSSDFSFIRSTLRCPVCSGSGIEQLKMLFLPDVRITCQRCHGRRFANELLEVKWNGKSFSDVLNMSIEEGAQFFQSQRKIAVPLQLLCDLGLGYLTIGHPTSMISGGEAQRIKLAFELLRTENKGNLTDNSKALYIFDEPTVGLHMQDIQRLLQSFHKLTEKGHTVLVIEHNTDIISQAEWVIELGPEAGEKGGLVIAQGTPYRISRGDTPTGIALQTHKRHRSS